MATTEPDTIEQYGIRVAEAWKLGRKGVDDGAILILAKDDRKLRIEVGYGLEGALPDAIAKRIVREDIAPRFRSGDYPGGIAVGVDRMIAVINGEALPPPKARRGASGSAKHPPFELLFVAFFIVWGVMSAVKRVLGTGLASLGVGEHPPRSVDGPAAPDSSGRTGDARGGDAEDRKNGPCKKRNAQPDAEIEERPQGGGDACA